MIKFSCANSSQRRIVFKNITYIRFQSCSSYIPAVRGESVPVHRVDGMGQVSVPVRTFDFWTLVSHPGLLEPTP